MANLRVAVLGAGFMGGTHGRAMRNIPGVEIAGIYGLSDTRVVPLAEELETTWTTDWQKLVNDPNVDAVDICLPGPQHREVTEAAIAAGKHVLLEKPIALTLEDANALVELASTTNLTFMIAHVCRFWAEYEEIHRRVASGDYGKPVSALAYRRQPFPAWSALFSKADLTGGGVMDMMIHDYDALNWILGTPRNVVSRGRHNPRSGGYDQVQVMIDYGSASGLVDGGMMMPESYPFTAVLHVLCEAGAFEYTFRAGGRSVEAAGGLNELVFYPNDGSPQILEVEQKDPYGAEIAYFAECAAAGRQVTRATPAESLDALRVALAARKALEGGMDAVAV